MTINLEFGWWLLPLAVTVAALAYAARADRKHGPGSLVALMVYAAALIASLIAWLVWSLAT